jgi:hypothetical protein
MGCSAAGIAKGALAVGGLLAVAVLALVSVVTGPAGAMDLPIRIDTASTLGQQFGYSPGYPLNVPSFDADNRPYVRSRTASQHVTRSVLDLTDDGRWAAVSLLKAIRAAFPAFTNTVNAGGYVSERVEIDTRGRAYTLVEIRVRGGRYYNVLLYSLNGCRTWRLVKLPFGGKRALYDGRDNGTAAMEQYAGWNVGSTPPLVAVWRPVSDWPGSRASRSLLYVVKPYFSRGRLRLPRPALVSRRFIGQTYGAGGSSFAVSAGHTSYIVWPEVARSGQHGTPTYACSFDHVSRTAGKHVLLALATPRNDDHDDPGIVRDGDGRLHVVTGAHNAPFLYVHSLRPLDATAWSAPEQILTGGYAPEGVELPGTAKQTYVSLACLPDGSLVVAFRQTRCGVDLDFDSGQYDALCCQRRSPEGEWGEAERVVCCADRAGYANYHQKLTVDRIGRLYLSLSYFSPLDRPSGESSAYRYTHRMVLISKDGGAEWDFATDEDYAEGMAQAGS